MRSTDIRRRVTEFVTIANLMHLSKVAIVVPDPMHIATAFQSASNLYMHETWIGGNGRDMIKMKSFADVYIFTYINPSDEYDLVYWIRS